MVFGSEEIVHSQSEFSDCCCIPHIDPVHRADCALEQTERETLLSLYTKHPPIPNEDIMVPAYNWTLKITWILGTYSPGDQTGLLSTQPAQTAYSVVAGGSAAIPAIY